MTLPHERTRSLVQAGELLAEISKDHSLPDEIRAQAKVVLRHYPSSKEILLIGKRDEMADDPFGPWLSSNTKI